MWLLDETYMVITSCKEDALAEVISNVEPDWSEETPNEDGGIYWVSGDNEYIVTEISYSKYRVEVYKGGY